MPFCSWTARLSNSTFSIHSVTRSSQTTNGSCWTSARDAEGRWLNVEMQVSVVPGLLQRLTYYACALYVDQLQAGQHYTQLRPAISICLLRQLLLSDTPVPHHRFRLVDPEHGRELLDGIEVHTVELAKYNLDEATISAATAIAQWAFFLLRADRYEALSIAGITAGRGVSAGHHGGRDHGGQDGGSTDVRPAREGPA